MATNQPPSRWLAVFVGGLALLLSTAAYLLSSPTLGVLALVSGGISFGLGIGPAKDD